MEYTPYIRALGEDRIPFESEILTEVQHFNEYLMTRLRTVEGIDLTYARDRWGIQWADDLEAGAATHLARGHAIRQENHIILTKEGKLFADGIAAGLFR
jgi:oxygen-independent coproporphyrinogen III oxidase